MKRAEPAQILGCKTRYKQKERKLIDSDRCFYSESKEGELTFHFLIKLLRECVPALHLPGHGVGLILLNFVGILQALILLLQRFDLGAQLFFLLFKLGLGTGDLG